MTDEQRLAEIERRLNQIMERIREADLQAAATTDKLNAMQAGRRGG